MKVMKTPYPSYSGAPVARHTARPHRRAFEVTPWLLYAAIVALISLALLPFFLLGGTYVFYSLSGRIYPGITVAHTVIGDLTREDAARKLDAEWNGQTRLILTDGNHTWPIAPHEVGLWIDPIRTAEMAYTVGRGEGGLSEMLWLARFQKWDVNPAVVFDIEAARTGLTQVASRVNVSAQNATLRLENGQWVAVPGQNGQMLNVEETLARLAARPQDVIQGGYVMAVVQPVAPRLADATPALERLHTALNAPLKLVAYDPITNETLDWTVPRENFANWVTVDVQEEELVLGLAGEPLNAYLANMQSQLGGSRVIEAFTPPGDLAALWQSGQPLVVEVRHMPTNYTVEPGETLTRIAFKVGMPYWMIQQANPQIDPDRLRAGEVLTIPSKNDLLPLPVIPGKRIVISISQQRMWVYENGSLRNEHVISTGIDRSPTIPGVYQVQTHEVEAYASVWDLYMPHFMGIYEGWPGFMNGIHGLPTLSNGNRLWAGNLGRPVSYGCIILGLQEAEDLFNWAEAGTIVEIQP